MTHIILKVSVSVIAPACWDDPDNAQMGTGMYPDLRSLEHLIKLLGVFLCIHARCSPVANQAHLKLSKFPIILGMIQFPPLFGRHEIGSEETQRRDPPVVVS